MKRAFIVAPNIGYSFTGGGGVKVALYMAQTLLEHGLKVHLIALTGWNVERINKIHGANLAKFLKEGRLMLNYCFGSRSDLKIPFPIAVKLVSIYVRQLVREYSPDLIIFHDDVPKLNERIFKYVSKTVLYSHFPYAARIYFNIVDAVEVGLERYQGYKTRLYYDSLKKLIYFKDIPKDIELVANSTVTKTFMEVTWKRPVKILYPPIAFQFKPVNKPKDNSIVLVGGQPNKRVGDAVKALAELKSTRRPIPKLYVIAHHFTPWYKDWLISLTQNFGLYHYVYFMEHLPEYELLDMYTSAKIVLSTAHFEPFGMSIAEGMLYRAVPIVYKGNLSGPWIDVIDKGRYGIGFKLITELAEIIDYVIRAGEDELIQLQGRAFMGSLRFSLDSFQRGFVELVKDVL
uniref:Glycosyltransferase n=1 Tax=Ignisphaera aggregans TaxID=334771 RepID=A0A7J3YU91_9CREN